jgi:hypothetical protein
MSHRALRQCAVTVIRSIAIVPAALAIFIAGESATGRLVIVSQVI